MDSNQPTNTADLNNTTTSSSETQVAQSSNKKTITIAVIVGVIVITGLIVILLSNKTAKDKPTATLPSSIPTQVVETQTGNSPRELESEAASIKVDDVETNLSDIDNDLKELN